jgi:oxygen-independent coproporphyrinogen-3 oxidase
MAGIYIHIPFCKKRCAYCDFFSSVSLDKRDDYVDALCRETSARYGYLTDNQIDTVYFGGGTPSLLRPLHFEKIFAALEQSFTLNLREVTLEVNPDDLNNECVAALRRLPFNRVSLGVQSFDDGELKILGRRHDAACALRAIEKLQNAGFVNISIDLMYGLPGQTAKLWGKTLQKAINCGVQHISAYHLTCEPATEFSRMLDTGEIVPVSEETSVALFEILIDTLAAAGFEHYEISNFARPGHRSLHNSAYWNGTTYLGLGAAAHSFDGKSRQWNVASVSQYIADCRFKPVGSEIIDPKTAWNDFVMTRLRCREGIALDELEARFDTTRLHRCLHQAEKHIRAGNAEITQKSLKLTRKGIFISDSVIIDLME